MDAVGSGRNGTGCVISVVERKIRMLFACRAEFCTAEKFHNALKKLIKILPPGIIKSFIGERGREVYRINNRPRKFLGWKTAQEGFTEEIRNTA